MSNIDSKDVVYNSGIIRNFVQISIPDDAIADSNIFPGRVLSGYSSPKATESEEEWKAYMLKLVQENSDATGVSWFMGKKPKDSLAGILIQPLQPVIRLC
jgi:hypothetical protein